MSSVKKSTGRPLTFGCLLMLASLLPAAAGDHDVGSSAFETCRLGKQQAFDRASGRAFDEESGRDSRHYPPDRLVDYLHMNLQMRFEDLNDRRFAATELLRFKPATTSPVTALSLHARGLRIRGVRLDGRSVEFYHDDETLSVRFEQPLVTDREHELSIEYICDHPWDGIFFTPDDPAALHYGAEVHTLGQAEANRHWFVAHDFPNERMTTELIVNVPAGYSVSSNGRLVSKLTSGDRANWHWLQDKPHVSYLVSLVIGAFDVVEIPHDRVPMAVWVPEGLGDRVMQTYRRTGEMLDLFEQRLGVAYPWDRYDQLVVKNFNAGGMEHTAATTMYSSAILDERALLDGDLDGLIAHELAHQWVGDLITCKSWEHIWLNEGWATFVETLWAEQRDGEDGYLDRVRGNFGVARHDRTTNALPMVSPVYSHADETFGRSANPYSKGASILHMLRKMLGEDVFWSGVRLYMNRHAMGLVETSDFRYAMEEVSGLGLEWFFDQWCYRPGCPNLDVAVRYEPSSRELLIDVEQTQDIDRRTPAMRFALPVHVRTGAGWTILEVAVAERSTSFRTVLEGVPSVVAVDPELHVLKTTEVDKPRTMWLAQAKLGPTIVARHAALEALGQTDVPEHVDLLATVIADEGQRYTIRSTALRSLRRFGSDQARAALLGLVRSEIAEARVRSELTDAARDLPREDVLDLLARRASEDESHATRAAAIQALAAHDATEHSDLMVELVGYDSHRQRVRGAALRALADLDDPRGLDLAMRYATYGHVDSSRPAAIDVMARLSEHGRARAVDLLIELLDDPEQRTRRAAVAALGRIGDERALEPLSVIEQSHRDPRMREAAGKAMGEIEEDQGSAISHQPSGKAKEKPSDERALADAPATPDAYASSSPDG